MQWLVISKQWLGIILDERRVMSVESFMGREGFLVLCACCGEGGRLPDIEHGAAGDAFAEHHNPRTLIASDLPQYFYRLRTED